MRFPPKTLLRCVLTVCIMPVLTGCLARAQDGMPMKHDAPAMAHKPSMPSRDLALTGPTGTAKVVTAADLKALPHITVTLTNGHTHQPESYSGVPLLEVLKLVPAMAGEPKPKPLTTVVVAQGTDGYRIVISLCDVDPACRNGKAMVADSMDGKPLTTDGEFKLILSEDTMPRRWVRNLSSLTEKTVD